MGVTNNRMVVRRASVKARQLAWAEERRKIDEYLDEVWKLCWFHLPFNDPGNFWRNHHKRWYENLAKLRASIKQPVRELPPYEELLERLEKDSLRWEHGRTGYQPGARRENLTKAKELS